MSKPHKAPQDKKTSGRPMKFKSPAGLKRKLEEYFAMCDANDKPYTVTGMALYLDTTRATLMQYENRGDAFSDVIKWGKLRCENYLEEDLVAGKGHPVGKIFSLKNNFNWTDKKEVESKGDINISFVDYSEDEDDVS